MSGCALDDDMYMSMEIPKLSEDALKTKLYVGEEIPLQKISELIEGFATFKDLSNPIVTKGMEVVSHLYHRAAPVHSVQVT